MQKKNSVTTKMAKILFSNIRAATLACAARLTNASHSPVTPFGRLTCIIKFFDNKNIRRDRIGQNNDLVNLHWLNIHKASI